MFEEVGGWVFLSYGDWIVFTILASFFVLS